jgi:hypothetical protein
MCSCFLVCYSNMELRLWVWSRFSKNCMVDGLSISISHMTVDVVPFSLNDFNHLTWLEWESFICTFDHVWFCHDLLLIWKVVVWPFSTLSNIWQVSALLHKDTDKHHSQVMEINFHFAQSDINYLLYYTQPTKTTSIRT